MAWPPTDAARPLDLVVVVPAGVVDVVAQTRDLQAEDVQRRQAARAPRLTRHDEAHVQDHDAVREVVVPATLVGGGAVRDVGTAPANPAPPKSRVETGVVSTR